jgi:hypothetical protein
MSDLNIHIHNDLSGDFHLHVFFFFIKWHRQQQTSVVCHWKQQRTLNIIMQCAGNAICLYNTMSTFEFKQKIHKVRFVY